jgi:hypothetical protein
MMAVPIRTGLLVRDNYAREGVVCESRRRPPESWIKDQRNVEDIRKLAPDVSWWSVMPLTGGLVVVPEPMLEVLRPASYEDFLKAADNANVEGRKYLATIFPEYVDRVIAERRGWRMH